jgi:UDP-N-acetylmuramoyl-L-alanyl-D-glutamate--2,6-diaminopimelate ligase
MDEFEKNFGASPVVRNLPENPLFLEKVTGDSREVLPGSVFCCVRGEKRDGLDFAAAAMEKGACAFLTDREIALPIPQLLTSDVRRDMGRLASIVYGSPSMKIKMFAVTGTNGKSTTTWMIRHILQYAGIRTGLFGTIVYNDGAVERDAGRTTPESYEIQRSLASMVENGCGACVMEASSHGLSLGRLEGCCFDGAIFTNLSNEHLDYHKTLEEYFHAKTRLFSTYMKDGWHGASNRDDLHGRLLLSIFSGSLIPFGIGGNNSEGVMGNILSAAPSGNEFSVSLPGRGKKLRIFLPLPGRFNVYNALGSIALLHSLVEDPEKIAGALRTMPQVPGRLERYYLSNGACVIIDFAHTPAALGNVLSELRNMCTGKLCAVFGHGGERFQPNRHSLGLTAAGYCDKVVVTMDNPRGEDPVKIADQIFEGISASEKKPETEIIIDRKSAIRKALDWARDGDVVAVTGKGPEKYLIIGNQTIPYSDRETVLDWAQERGLTWK